MAVEVRDLTVRARQHLDGSWTVTVHGYVDGVYRIEQTHSIEDIEGSIRRFVEFFYAKHAGAHAQ